MHRSIGSLKTFLGATVIPPCLVDVAELPAFLDRIHVLDYSVQTRGADFESTVTVAVERDVSTGFSPVAGARFFIGDAAAPVTFIRATVAVEQGDLSITLHGLQWTLRFGSGAVGGSGKPSELSFQ